MSEGAHADTSEHTTVHKDSEMKRTGKGKKHDNLARQAQLNPGYHKHDFKQKLGEAFKQGQAFSHGKNINLDLGQLPPRLWHSWCAGLVITAIDMSSIMLTFGYFARFFPSCEYHSLFGILLQCLCITF